jgi:spore germination protein YaaH
MRRAGWAVVLLLMLLAGGVPARAEALGVDRVTAGEPAAQASRAVVVRTVQGALAQAPSVPNRRVLGYYVPDDPASWASLEAQAGLLDIVAGQWVTVDGCGQLASQDDQTLKQLARSKGVQVFPTLLTTSSWVNHRLLTDQDTTARLVDQVVGYVQDEGYDGFDLDLENILPGDREPYTALVGRLATALHQQGKTLSLAVPAKAKESWTGWAGAYDYAALGQRADLITVMAYEYHGSWGGPGPIAPYDDVEATAAYATSQMLPEKVLLGVAFYGFDWNTTSGGARYLGYPEAAALSERYGVPLSIDPASRSATLQYQARGDEQPPTVPRPPAVQHEITRREAPPCAVAEPPVPTPTPRATPRPDVMQQHEVWLEESTSLAARLPLAAKYQTGGVAAWRLGHEDPAIWPLVERWRRGGL